MLGINMNDVITTLGMIKGYLISLAVILVVAVAVTIAAMKLPKPTKGIAKIGRAHV